MRHVVIMAGGSGTRFWPRSRQARPKQLIRIVGQGTMLQETAQRLRQLAPPSRTLVITTRAQLGETKSQLLDFRPEQIIGEPQGRDTGPCVALAAAMVHHADGDGVMVVVPADHVIRPRERLVGVLEAACEAAEREACLITLGITPAGPSEAYGYIRRGGKLFDVCGRGVYKAAEFREKPQRAVAAGLVRSGEWLWNSGIFVWRARSILDALRKHAPALYDAACRMGEGLASGQAERAIEAEYGKIGRISIDYAVLEKADNVALIEADFLWDDVGSWLALERHIKPDDGGNVVGGLHEGVDTANCIVAGDTDHLVATLGVSDLIIVHTPDATLVCHKSRAADMKTLVARLAGKGLQKYL